MLLKVENDGKVIFGSTVSVKDLENNKKISFKIVGKDEADVKKLGLIWIAYRKIY